MADGEDIMNSAPGKLIRKLSGETYGRLKETLIPIPRGVGLSVIPRPEKFYFAFGKPIQTRVHKGKEDDIKRQKRVRKQTADAIEVLLAETLLYRAQTRNTQSVWRKLLQKT